MSTTTGRSTTPTLAPERPSRFRALTAPRTRVIRDWDPEDTAAWEAGNKQVARRNLVWSVATEHVGFSIWSIWSVMVLFMPQAVYGFTPPTSSSSSPCRPSSARCCGCPTRWPRPSSAAATGRSSAASPSWCRRSLPGGSWSTRALPHHLPRRRGSRGPRRRQLRLLDDEHQRLLPAADEGLGARAQRRGRQHRGARHPARRPARHRDAGQPSARGRLRRLPRAARRGERRGGLLHGQPRPPDGEPARDARGPAHSALVVHFAALHRHVRLVHRLRLRLRPGAQPDLPRRPDRGRRPDGRPSAAASLHAAQIAFVGPLLGSVSRVWGGRLADRRGGAAVTSGPSSGWPWPGCS